MILVYIKIGNNRGPSTTSHQRVLKEQLTIEAMLGMEHLQNGLDRTHITEDDLMGEPAAVPLVSRTVDTKRRILDRYYTVHLFRSFTKFYF